MDRKDHGWACLSKHISGIVRQNYKKLAFFSQSFPIFSILLVETACNEKHFKKEEIPYPGDPGQIGVFLK
jgi:hypothetical protein